MEPWGNEHRKKRMTEETAQKPSRWFRRLAIAAILWNLMGCMMFLVEVFAQESAMESMSEEQKEWARSIPSWVYFAYAIAVASGLTASIGLLMRKSWAVCLFSVSLLAVVAQMSASMFAYDGLQIMGPSSAAMPTLIIIIAAALLWYSRLAKSRTWLN